MSVQKASSGRASRRTAWTNPMALTSRWAASVLTCLTERESMRQRR